MRRSGGPLAQNVNTVSNIHSRHDPFAVDYGLWPFDDTFYDIVCTVTNSTMRTNLSLWTPLLTEDARRNACAQYRGRCCNCGCTDHSLLWCPLPFKNVFSLLNPEFATLDPDGSMFKTWKRKMRNWRRKGPQRRHSGNGKRHTSDNAPARPHNSGHPPATLSNPAGTPLALSTTALPLLRLQQCVLALYTTLTVTRTPDNQGRLGYNQTRDGAKTVLPHP